MTKKYFITTFGCQANHSDSERIAGVLEKAGFQKARNEKMANVLVFNSCSVRQTAEDRIFGLNKKFKSLKIQNSKLKIVLTGCMARYSKKELKKRLPDIDIFLAIRDLKNLPGLLSSPIRLSDSRIGEYLSLTPKYESGFRAYVPISSGCDNFCSYCVVPYARGREHDRPAKEIISEVKNLVKKGYKEIWLLGQNVNSWRSKLTTKNEKRKTAAKNLKLLRKKSEDVITFSDLLKTINKIPGNFWLRFTSPHPKDFPDDLIKTMAECEKFPEYLNLPVQSGDNAILKKMNRPYAREYYIKLVKKIRKAMPNISLSTDVIVGFPGETKKQFQNTADLLKKIKFDMAYISEYSERPGTLAQKKFKDDISKKEKARRKKYLTEILAKTALQNNEKLIGKTIEVLIDKEKNIPSASFDKTQDKSLRTSRFFGRTAGNKVVELLRESDSQWESESRIGKFAKVKIIKAEHWKLDGKIC